MNPDLLTYLSAVAFLLLYIRAALQCSFYRGYFEQKQRNLGKDPQTALKREFPGIERFWFYVLLWRPGTANASPKSIDDPPEVKH
jgi:hypothetical protein